jgi:hypothetical protein
MIEFRRLMDDKGKLFTAAYAMYEVSFPFHEQRRWTNKKP